MKFRGAKSRLKTKPKGMSKTTQQYIRMVLEARKSELELRVLSQKDAPFISAVASAELEKVKCGLAISEFEREMSRDLFTMAEHGYSFLTVIR